MTGYAAASDVPGDSGFLTPTNDRDVVIVDVDQDGLIDVVHVDETGPTTGVLIHYGQGDFAFNASVSLPGGLEPRGLGLESGLGLAEVCFTAREKTLTSGVGHVASHGTAIG